MFFPISNTAAGNNLLMEYHKPLYKYYCIKKGNYERLPSFLLNQYRTEMSNKGTGPDIVCQILKTYILKLSQCDSLFL